ncbi:MAG: Flp pilus assembly complex ATPase component TadA, partial [Nitrospirota bacterium]
MDINSLLKKSFKMGASDLHVKVGSHPIARVHGDLKLMTEENKVAQEDAIKVAFTVMSPGQREIFKKKNDIDLAYSVPGLGRFRCNIFIQRGTIGMVFRVIPVKIPSIDELNLPNILKKISLEPRGLILVTGTTGSGKSTTLAAMIDAINANKTDNIITIEDPIEYLHRDRKSIINQREVGSDTDS